jgi:hypothetical protein
LNVSTTADAIAQDDRTNIGSSTISRLDELEQKKNKESALAKKTKDLLMKGKATGDNGIAQEDRIYVIVSFVDDAAARKCVFFNKKTTSFGDFAENIGKKFPFPAFKKAMRPTGMSLEVRLKDDYIYDNDDDNDGEAEKKNKNKNKRDDVVTPHGIDRGRLLVDALNDMSELEVAAASSAELAEAQTRVEGYVAELRQQREREQQEREEEARRKKEEEDELETRVDPANVQPGDTYIYTKEAGSGSRELVKVVTVHQDDFPNLYFTIQFLSDLDRQKQTTAAWLKLVAVPSPKGGGFTITVTHGLQSYSVGGLSPDMSVAALKVLVQAASGVAPKKQKLICRGGILKDTDALSQTKVVKNSKVSLMGKK